MNQSWARHDFTNLRATLCLLFPEPVACRLAALAAQDKPNLQLSRLVGRTLLQLRFDRLRRRSRWIEAGYAGIPLGPSSGIGPHQSIALALLLGLNLPATELAELLHRSIDEIGGDLYEARSRLSPRPLFSCPEFMAVLGRHADSSLDINQRVTLLRHASGCAECRQTLETFQEIDNDLRQRLSEACATAPAALPRPSYRDRLLTSSKLWLGAGSLLLVVIVILAGIGVSRVVGERQRPVPLLAAAKVAADGPSGWLLTADPNSGSLQAIDLAGGQSREIGVGSGSPGSSYVLAALSPNQRLIASWGPMYSATGPASQVPLVVSTLDGSGVFQHVWPLPNAPTLAGWLDNSHVLMASVEQLGGPTSSDYSSSVISVDITNGEIHTMLTLTGRSSIEDVVASPDGSLIALDVRVAVDKGN
ncbi:MAG TPA: hypothetical protein VKU87_06875, partial [Thermomicrobiaceae bacterium]|nr:hypothetical protein [Thermomicrobiaceae bacterium]